MMATAKVAKTVLKIPLRIERGPTDILKALASTVKHVPGIPDSWLQDDVYLLPIRPSDRRMYILSKLSGQKTAKYILNKYPELFFRDDSEPKVDAFLPREEFSQDMDLNEEDIKWCIANGDAPNGVIAYESLQEKDIKISDDTLLDFFELLCYANEESLIDLVDYERSRFLPDSEERLVKQTWKTNGLASKIFSQIKVDFNPPRVYSAMIAGLCKYNEHSTAKEIFEEFRDTHPDKGLSTIAYSGLLDSIRRVYSSVSTAHQAVDEIVRHMESNLVKPDLLVFNSILKTYRSFNVDDSTAQKTLSLLNDMRTLDIEPSLFTYANFIAILFRYKNGRIYGDLVDDVLSEIESSDSILQIKDERDATFLSSVMTSFVLVINNLKLAKRLHKIYLRQPNLFVDHRSKTRYLNTFFKLMITTDSLENSLKFYKDYVPSTFMPSPDTFEALAETLDLYQAPEEVVKAIGQDIINFRVYDKIKNDAIFRKDQSYIDAVEKALEKNN